MTVLSQAKSPISPSEFVDEQLDLWLLFLISSAKQSDGMSGYRGS